MNTPRIIFGLSFIQFSGILLEAVFIENIEDRFQLVCVAFVSVCIWGSMTFFAKSRISSYRIFWIACASIAVAFFGFIFGSTVFYEETPDTVFSSDQEYRVEDTQPKVEYLYQKPWLFYRVYLELFGEIWNRADCHPITVVAAFLALTLPMAFCISVYRCWRPIRQNGE